MKSRYVFAGIVTIALVLVTIGLLQVVSANDPGNQTISWTGGGDGVSWGDASNWNLARVPLPSDKVYLSAGAQVTISSAQSVTWLHSDRPIAISSGGSLTLAEDSLVQSTLALGGNLDGAGNLTITDLLTWSAGTMSGTGTTTAYGGISH